MPKFIATHQDTKETVEYDEAAPRPEHLVPPWRVAQVFDGPCAPEPGEPDYVGPWKITRLAFRSRFTVTEKAQLEIASLDNPTADMPARIQAATLRAYLQDAQAAQFIDLTRPDTRAGVLMLEAAGLLAAGRAAVILDTPPTDTEVYLA